MQDEQLEESDDIWLTRETKAEDGAFLGGEVGCT